MISVIPNSSSRVTRITFPFTTASDLPIRFWPSIEDRILRLSIWKVDPFLAISFICPFGPYQSAIRAPTANSSQSALLCKQAQLLDKNP
jgi:hypothetical protein